MGEIGFTAKREKSEVLNALKVTGRTKKIVSGHLECPETFQVAVTFHSKVSYAVVLFNVTQQSPLKITLSIGLRF